LKRKIVTTGDGARTIFIEDWNEHYHSKHGAINESLHVFIKNGLLLFSDQHISILEIGFGTGLNAFLSLLKASSANLNVNYTAIEAYPLKNEEIKALNYPEQVNKKGSKLIFEKLHDVSWEKEHLITANFCLIKKQMFFQDIDYKNSFDLIFFDAFGARVQPELWTEEIFKKMFTSLKKKGVLVTYAAKGSVRRAMKSCGFLVEKLPGPPGKREMLRAIKP
jgi:tRNA U34 5-methylaminomethyl-2-thiouridine-forming methyltransferase MnmC